jgi:glycerol kinase
MTTLAIDQGTSATKALVVADDGSVLAEAEVAVGIHSTPDGGVEQDPAEILTSVLQAGHQALEAVDGEVTSVALANQGESVVAIDSTTGEARSPIISWQDRRAAELTAALSERHGNRLFEISGLPLDPYFTAPKLAWLQQRCGAGEQVCGIDAWLNRQLTGRFVTDAATASRSGVLDLTSRTWSTEATSVFGIDVEALPAVVDCAGHLGSTDAFGPTLEMTALIVDQQAALVGEGCLDPGEAKCTFGTGAFLLASTGARPVWSTVGLSSSVAHQIAAAAAWCLDGQVYAAGAALGWLVGTGLLRSPAALDGQLRRADPSDGTLCVPAFSGLGAPHWAPQARASFEGIGLATGADEIVSAVTEGLCAQVALLAGAASIDIGTGLRVLRVDGGLTRSEELCQRQADLLQAPVEVFGSPHATALGLAALARVGAGTDTQLAPTHPEGGRTFVPRISSDEAAARLDTQRAAMVRAVEAAR